MPKKCKTPEEIIDIRKEAKKTANAFINAVNKKHTHNARLMLNGLLDCDKEILSELNLPSRLVSLSRWKELAPTLDSPHRNPWHLPFEQLRGYLIELLNLGIDPNQKNENNKTALSIVEERMQANPYNLKNWERIEEILKHPFPSPDFDENAVTVCSSAPSLHNNAILQALVGLTAVTSGWLPSILSLGGKAYQLAMEGISNQVVIGDTDEISTLQVLSLAAGACISAYTFKEIKRKWNSSSFLKENNSSYPINEPNSLNKEYEFTVRSCGTT